MSDFAPHDYTFKVVLCGDSGVGKSNILGRYTKDEFSESAPSTIGVEFTTKATSHDGKHLAIQIWDTAGQERFHSIARSYYRGAVGAFVVYDVTSKPSLEHARRWLSQLKQHAHPSIVVCLLGNKCDLEEKRQVQREDGQAFADENNMLFFEVSAKDATNINAAFSRMIVDIYNLVKQPSTGPASDDATGRVAKSETGASPASYAVNSANSVKLSSSVPTNRKAGPGQDGSNGSGNCNC